jgi:hypothetical protein
MFRQRLLLIILLVICQGGDILKLTDLSPSSFGMIHARFPVQWRV